MAGLRQYMPQTERERARRLGPSYEPQMLLTESTEWKGILDLTTWNALRGKFAADRRSPGHRPARSLLAGLVFCGHDDCIGAALGHSSRGYQCSATRGGCGRVGVAGSGLEKMILGMVAARLEVTDLGALVAPEASSGAEQERERLQEAFDRLLPLFEAGVVTAEELTVRRRRLDAQLSELDANLGQRQVRTAQLRKMQETLAVWESASTPEQATVLRALISKIVVRPSSGGKRSGPRFDPERVTVHWSA